MEKPGGNRGAIAGEGLYNPGFVPHGHLLLSPISTQGQETPSTLPPSLL